MQPLTKDVLEIMVEKAFAVLRKLIRNFWRRRGFSLFPYSCKNFIDVTIHSFEN